MRVLAWMLERIEGKAKGQENIFGTTPSHKDINWAGLDFSEDQFNQVTSIDKAVWQEEMKLHDQLFDQLSYHLPKELVETKRALEKRLAS
jgi:phosphoenolpyruvate carboxykinase (GTP)